MTKLLRLVLAITVATTLHFTAAAQSLSINTTGLPIDPAVINYVISVLQ